MKVALALCGLAILAQASLAHTTKAIDWDELELQEPRQPVEMEPGRSWEERYLPPGSDKHLLPNEHYDGAG